MTSDLNLDYTAKHGSDTFEIVQNNNIIYLPNISILIYNKF